MLLVMRRSVNMRVLTPIVLVGALAFVAACGSAAPTGARFSRDGVAANCAPYVDTLPTAIPTEQWTPEWLSGWSQQHEAAYRTYSDENIARFIEAHGDASRLPRTPNLADLAFLPVGDALQQSDRVIAGGVTDQWLSDEGAGRYGLVSRIQAQDGTTTDVHQYVSVECTAQRIVLSYPDARPLMQQGGDYALLAQSAHGVTRVVGSYAYSMKSDGSLEVMGEFQRADFATLRDIRARFDASRRG